MLWDGTAWQLGYLFSDVGVTSVSVTAPITDAGTAAEPNILVSLMLLTLLKVLFNWLKILLMVVLDPSTNAEDVLIVSHFDELAGRITTAAGGGVQSCYRS